MHYSSNRNYKKRKLNSSSFKISNNFSLISFFFHFSFLLFYISPSSLVFLRTCRAGTKTVMLYPSIFWVLLLYAQLLINYRVDHLVIYFWLENVVGWLILRTTISFVVIFFTSILKKSVWFISFIRLLIRYTMDS